MFRKLLFLLVSCLGCLTINAAQRGSLYPTTTTLGNSDFIWTIYYDGAAYTTNKTITYANFATQLYAGASFNANVLTSGTIPEARMPALTGDVTTSAGAVATTIANNAVTTVKIADGNVTLAKQANIATDSILGRATASAGIIEVLTALPFAFTGDVTRPADSNAQTIPNDTVTYAKMQNTSAASRLLGRGSASGAGDIEELTIGSGLSLTGTALSATASGLAGTMISSGTPFVAGTVPIATDITGTNFAGTATITVTTTNASFKGTVFVDNLVATNGITLGTGGTNLAVTGGITADNGAFTNGVTIYDVTASKLLRTDSNKKLSAVTIGTGITFDGTTLAATGVSDNWVASGTTNSTLTGNGFANALYATNGFNSQGTGAGTIVLTNSAATFTYGIQPHGTMSGNVVLLGPAAGFSGIPKWANSSGTMTPSAAVAMTDYLDTTAISDTAIAGSWNGVTTIAPSKNTIHDWAILFDTDLDGLVNSLDTSVTLGNADTTLERESTAVFQFGADSATAVAQTLKTADGSGTDKVGGSITIAGGQSTGTGRGGSIIVKTSPSSTTGASANAYSERFHATSKHVALTAATATTIMNIACASGKWVGGQFTCTVNADDGTNFQALTSEIRFSAVNKAGTITAAITPSDGTAAPSIVASSSGTLTPVTYTIVVNGNSVDIKVAATSSLSETTLNATYVITALNSNTTAAVTEQ